jgi:hypothetical protein
LRHVVFVNDILGIFIEKYNTLVEAGAEESSKKLSCIKMLSNSRGFMRHEMKSLT